MVASQEPKLVSVGPDVSSVAEGCDSGRCRERVFDEHLTDENVEAGLLARRIPMRLKSLIEWLENGVARHGDIPVVTQDRLPRFGDFHVPNIPLVGVPAVPTD